MKIVNLLDRSGTQVTPRTHIQSVYFTDGTPLSDYVNNTSGGLEISGTVTKVSNPLTISMDSQSLGTYDGSSAVNVNIDTSDIIRETDILVLQCVLD